MMPPEIEKAVELIDAKILELRQAKATLLELFGEKLTYKDSSPLLFSGKNVVGKKGPNRRDALIKFLLEEGPLSRSEIYARSGIPKGTVAGLLTDKNTFYGKEGKWYPVQQRTKQGDEKE